MRITPENWKTTLKMPSEWWHIVWMSKNQSMILDPDGWDRKNWEKSWWEEITYSEFEKRAMLSTVYPVPEYIIAMNLFALFEKQ